MKGRKKKVAKKRRVRTGEKMVPLFSRIYKRHRMMIKTIMKDKEELSTSAKVVRLAIEKLFELHEAEKNI